MCDSPMSQTHDGELQQAVMSALLTSCVGGR